MKRILPTDAHLFTIIIQNVRRSILLFSPIFLSFNSYSQTIDLKSLNGEMLISGKQEFTESWTSSKASRDKGLWWQDHYYVKEEDRNYQPWEDAVKNAVSPLVGQITAKGPCSICIDQVGTGKQYGARIKMFDAETGAGFIPCPLKGVLEKGFFNHGWVPEGKEVIIDVYAVMGSYNNMVNTGEFLYPAPQDVEYEIWYFPRGEGSDVVVTGGPRRTGR